MEDSTDFKGFLWVAAKSWLCFLAFLSAAPSAASGGTSAPCALRAVLSLRVSLSAAARRRGDPAACSRGLGRHREESQPNSSTAQLACACQRVAHPCHRAPAGARPGQASLERAAALGVQPRTAAAVGRRLQRPLEVRARGPVRAVSRCQRKCLGEHASACCLERPACCNSASCFCQSP